MCFARTLYVPLLLLCCVGMALPDRAQAQSCSGGPNDPNITGASGSVSVTGGDCVFVSPTGAVAGQVRTSGAYTTTNQGSVTNPGGFGIRDTTNDTTVVNQSAITARNGIDLRARSAVNNSGTINATSIGVRIRSDGSVLHTGTITSGTHGIFADDDASIISSGDINAGVIGIRVRDRGSVQSSSTISSGSYGVLGRNQATLQTSGSITSGRESIFARDAARITNSATLNSNRTGIQARSDSIVTNTGDITSVFHGIYGLDRTTIRSTATINAGRYGIYTRDQGNVTTAGSITAGFDAIRGRNGAAITNTATLNAGRSGIIANNDAQIQNSSAITSVRSGLQTRDRGTITTSGSINAGTYGIFGRNDSNITASGTISAGLDGIRASNRATISSSADITMSRYGILTTNDAVVSNRGDINATRTGIRTSNRSVIDSAGAIDATQYGIQGGNQTRVTAAGSIRSGFDGIRLVDNGTIQSSADITSMRRGIYLRNNGSLENSGDIQSVLRGLEVRDDNTVVNRGKVQSSTQQGIYGRRRNTIVNRGAAIGTIGIHGITDTQVVNSGRIVGTSGTALRFNNGTNSLTLQSGSQISGDLQGGTGQDSLFLEGSGRYNGSVLAFESLVRRGSGIWALGGNSTIAGPVQISGGTLQVDGILDATTFTVDPRGTLSGFGTVVPAVDVAGSVAPGTDGRVGTLTLQGDVRFRRGSQLLVDVTPRGGDRLQVGGAATLQGGRIVVKPEPGSYQDGDRFDVLVAGNGRTGRFSSVETSGSAVLRFNVLNLKDRVRLTVERLPYGSLPALTPNQTSIAQTLDGVVSRGGSSAGSLSSKLDFLSEQEIATALTMLDPQPMDVYPELVDHWTEVRFDSITRRLRDARSGSPTVGMWLRDPEKAGSSTARLGEPLPPVASAGSQSLKTSDEDSPASNLLDPPVQDSPIAGASVWAYGLGLFGDKRSKVDVTGYDFDGGGAIVGGDLPLSERFRLGAAFTWQDTDVRFDRRGARGRIENQGIALYGSFESGGPIFAELALQHLWNDYETARRITFPGVSRRATSSHEGRVFAAQGSVGLRSEWQGLAFEPRVGLRYARLTQDSFTEQGAGDLNLHLKSRRSDGLENFVGLRVARPVRFADSRVVIAPEIHGEWSREWLNQNRDIRGSFVGLGNAAFTVQGDHRSQQEWSTGVGLVATVDERLRFEVQYDFQKGRDHVRSHAVLGGLKWTF